MKNKILILLIILFLPLTIFNSLAQNEDGYDDFGGIKYRKVDKYKQDTTKTLKALFIDAGFSNDGLSFAFGVRYWNLFFDIGSANIALQSKPYSYQPPYGMNFSRGSKLPVGYSYSYIAGSTVFVDIGYYLAHLQKLNFFIMVGFYAQEEIITVMENESRLHYYLGRSTQSGWTLGGGMEYKLSQWISIALGYHQKRGVFSRFSYTWR